MVAGGAIHGRRGELDSLRAAVARVRDGRGRVVLLEGEPGIGKSRLLDAAAEVARELGVGVSSGRSREVERDVPFALVCHALGIVAGRGPERAALAELLRQDPRPDRDLRYQVMEGVIGLVEREALQGPLLLGLDDLHWADPSSLEVLTRLAAYADSLPLTVVATMRSLPRRPELDTFLRAVEDMAGIHLVLGPLATEDVEALITEMAEEAPSPRLLHYMAGVGGNPLLISELFSSLRETGRLVTSGRSIDLVDGSLPRSFRSLVLRRLHRLPDPTRHLLQVASVLGAQFGAGELAVVIERAPTELLETLEPALRDGLVGEAGPDLGFRHHLVRDAIYEELPLNLRRAIHQQAGRALARAGGGAARVAGHLMEGASGSSPEALQWLERAALEAMPRGPATAVELFDQALRLAPPGSPDHDRLLIGRAYALIGSGQAGECVAVARRILPALAGGSSEAALRYVLAMALLQLGAAREAAEELEALAAWPGLSARDAACYLGDAGLAHLLSGGVERGQELAATSLQRAREIEDEYAGSVARASLAMVAYFEARIPEAVELSRQALAGTRQSVEPVAPYRPVHLWLALGLAEAERLEESAHVIEAGRQASEASGMTWHIALYHAAAGRRHWVAGEWDDMIAELETSIALAQELRIGWSIVQGHALMSYVAFQRGQPDRVRAELAAAMQAIEAAGPQFGTEVLLWVRALSLEAAGHVAEAYEMLTTAWNLLRSGYFVQYLWLGPDLVRVALALGEVAMAREVAGEVSQAAANSGLASAKGIAQRCQGLVEHDPALLMSAVDCLRGSVRRVELGFACLDAGVMLGTNGRRVEAVLLLREALREFQRVDARLPVQRTAAALRSLGARPSGLVAVRRERVGWQALTGTELAVVRGVAEGLTSREIGDQLSISRRTVETHLAHVYSKLGLSSRVQLATAYAEQRTRARPLHRPDVTTRGSPLAQAVSNSGGQARSWSPKARRLPSS